MADFPRLKTGALAQYPIVRQRIQPARVLSFLDGSEQRFPGTKAGIAQWRIRLELLDESEAQDIWDFFLQQRGSLETFSFTDPLDGTEYPKCVFVQPKAQLGFIEEGRIETEILIRTTE
jgi:phage-related protein